MFGRKFPSTLKIARSFGARSSLDRESAVWPIKISASTRARASSASGGGLGSNTTNSATASNRCHVSASKIISMVRGRGSITIRGFGIRQCRSEENNLSLIRFYPECREVWPLWLRRYLPQKTIEKEDTADGS